MHPRSQAIGLGPAALRAPGGDRIKRQRGL